MIYIDENCFEESIEPKPVKTSSPRKYGEALATKKKKKKKRK